MSKKSSLKDAVGKIQPNQPLRLPHEQAFAAPKQVSALSPVLISPAGEIEPEDTEGTLGKICPQDENSTQDLKSTYPHKTRPTREEKTAKTLEKLRRGFTRLPNSVLMNIVYGDLSKAETKILLLIARYTIS